MLSTVFVTVALAYSLGTLELVLYNGENTPHNIGR